MPERFIVLSGTGRNTGTRNYSFSTTMGRFSSLGSDAVRGCLSAHGESSALHPGKIALVIFNRLYRKAVILQLPAVAAAIACRVTTLMVTSVRESCILTRGNDAVRVSSLFASPLRMLSG